MEAASIRGNTGQDSLGGRATRDSAVVQQPPPTTANPGPLGLAAFALTTFVLSMFNSGLVSDKGVPVVLGLALAYGGIAQLLAGMWEFRTGNTFGATAFTSYGAFWISFWAYNQFFAKDITSATDAGHAVGLYLIAWGIFTSYMFIASLRTTAAISLVFILLAATFIVLGIGEATASTGTVKLGGWIGLATALAAWYASFAEVTNATFNRAVLPTKPLRR
jgi:succinate-acetate transporter protein